LIEATLTIYCCRLCHVLPLLLVPLALTLLVALVALLLLLVHLLLPI